MEFIHDPYQPGETIAAIATPIGEGGVAIVRISGIEAVAVADRVFSGPVTSYYSHTAHFGKVLNPKSEEIDEALLLVMKGPKSYTGEDTVEIHCHGGNLITRRVLDAVLASGARLAQPGEFTFKAFMNGKLDLAKAEAVQMLIGAKSERALDAAKEQLLGSLSTKVALMQKELTQIAAILEAWVDFPEEGLEFATLAELLSDLVACTTTIDQLTQTFHEGKLISQGIALCLVGCPNAGKSSLMNVLLDKERAIVSQIAGTTRDVVEDQMQLRGLHVRLFDTAGVREADDVIEQEGIRRTKEALKKADLILLVLEAPRGIQKEERELFDAIADKKTVAIWNKMDLPHDLLPKLPFSHVAEVSALKKQGFEELISLIDDVLWEGTPPSKEETVITNVRHLEALKKAKQYCEEVISGLKAEQSPEFLAAHMRYALLELGKILGTNVGEDVLTAIFSTFCIGK